MPTSYRWYRLRVRGVDGASEIEERLLAYSGEASFRRLTDQTEQMVCAYGAEIWVDRFDGDGGLIRERVEGVATVQFSLIDKSDIVMRVANPPRNLRVLMSALEEALDFRLSVTPLVVTLEGNSAVIASVDVRKLTSLKVHNVVVGNDCVARMEFASKDGLRIEDLHPIVGLDYQITHVRYDLEHDAVKGTLVMACNGLVRIGGALSPYLRQMVEVDVFCVAAQRHGSSAASD